MKFRFNERTEKLQYFSKSWKDVDWNDADNLRWFAEQLNKLDG